MINHTDCDHPSTSSARAKCRRARGKGEVQVWPAPPLYSLGPRPAEKRVEWGGKAHHDPNRERNRGTTPRDRDKQCMVCGVERIIARGTVNPGHPFQGLLMYVGERCSYLVERSDDFEAVP